MTIFSKNLGGMAPLAPPLRLWFETLMGQRDVMGVTIKLLEPAKIVNGKLTRFLF